VESIEARLELALESGTLERTDHSIFSFSSINEDLSSAAISRGKLSTA
jgi:hypothetical protein